MKCPSDGTTLSMTTRDGIEIDYCPECRGVWLDRGELDKLIERSNNYAQPASAPGPGPQQAYPQTAHRDYDDDDDDDHYRREHGSYRGGSDHYNQHGHKKKKEGFLGDLFDF